jgi:hypothetical protein
LYPAHDLGLPRGLGVRIGRLVLKALDEGAGERAAFLWRELQCGFENLSELGFTTL